MTILITKLADGNYLVNAPEGDGGPCFPSKFWLVYHTFLQGAVEDNGCSVQIEIHIGPKSGYLFYTMQTVGEFFVESSTNTQSRDNFRTVTFNLE